MGTEFIVARNSNLNHYLKIPLYYRSKQSKYNVYKPVGVRLADLRVQNGKHPDPLFLHIDDKISGLQEVQRNFNRQLRKQVASNNKEEIRDTLSCIVHETLSEPRSGSLEGVSETVGILLKEYADAPNIMRSLMDVSAKDYTTVLHSINVMALALCYASHVGMPVAKRKSLGVAALLHDVGKTRVDSHILQAPRRLSEDEFAEMRRHPNLGYEILKRCHFGDPAIKQTALSHHERRDGSGYPNGMARIPEFAEIVGFIDCYEALTNDDRPYRNAMDPIKALTLIKDDVEAGKFTKTLFEKFAYSLL